MNPVYARAIQTALRLIAKFGQTGCNLVIPAADDPDADEWRDNSGEPTKAPVTLAFFPAGTAMPVFALMAGSEVPKHDELALLAPGDYTPTINMTVERPGGVIAEIVHMDKLAPDGTPVLYTLYLAIRG